MKTKVIAPKVKKVTPGAQVAKVVKVAKVSNYSIMMESYKANKDEIYSLSGAIKNFNPSEKFLKVTKMKLSEVTDKFILSNATKFSRLKNINGSIYQIVYLNKVATDKLKTRWSPWDIYQIVYFATK